MSKRSMPAFAFVFVAGLAIGRLSPGGDAGAVHAQAANRVFEIRTYTAPEGKLEELHARFRNHTLRIFQKHNMTSIAYFRPQDAPLAQNTLIYVLAHPSREAAKKNWADFQADPEWQKVSAESQVNGRIVSKVESVFADPADYSPIK
ncbi:MAG TPA: NIPSNAP family protein [Vicinamibacterales bacterium]|nr:NIPSNAP family protein [Vicinamibacterales bacterium]